jgi:hypothetical protein
MGKDTPPIHFLIPCAQNWPSSDAAAIVGADEGDKRAIHFTFFQTTLQLEHDIYAKGLNHVRDVIQEIWKHGEGPHVYYHYVLTLLTQDDERLQIPKWRQVLVDSKTRQKDRTTEHGMKTTCGST